MSFSKEQFNHVMQDSLSQESSSSKEAALCSHQEQFYSGEKIRKCVGSFPEGFTLLDRLSQLNTFIESMGLKKPINDHKRIRRIVGAPVNK